MSDKLLVQVQSLPAVKSVARFDGQVEVKTAQAQEALVHILELFNHTATDVTALRVLEPNLETVFLQLTGKQLRE
jgi:hypothetical protein